MLEDVAKDADDLKLMLPHRGGSLHWGGATFSRTGMLSNRAVSALGAAAKISQHV